MLINLTVFARAEANIVCGKTLEGQNRALADMALTNINILDQQFKCQPVIWYLIVELNCL